MRIPTPRRYHLLVAAGLIGTALAAPSATPAAAEADIAAQLAKFHAVHMWFDSSSLTPRQRQLVGKLAIAVELPELIVLEGFEPPTPIRHQRRPL